MQPLDASAADRARRFKPLSPGRFLHQVPILVKQCEHAVRRQASDYFALEVDADINVSLKYRYNGQLLINSPLTATGRRKAPRYGISRGFGLHDFCIAAPYAE